MKIRYVILILLLGSFLAACNFTLAEDLTPPPDYVSPTPVPTMGALFPSQPPSPVRGQAIFAVECTPCHGTDGLGNGPQAAGLPVPVSAIGLQDIASQSNPAKWYTIITQGQMDRYMPPFTSLSAAQRWDVLAYVYTLSNTSSQVEQGAALYASLCVTCHGLNGDGSTGQATGFSVDFSNQAFMSQVTALGMYQAVANGLSPQMPAFNSQLDDTQIWSVAAYLRTLTFDNSAQVAEGSVPTITATAISSSQGTPTQQDTASIPADTTPAGTLAGTQLATPEVTSLPAGLTATVSGQISNGSGGQVPTDLGIILHGYVNMNETVNLNTLVKPDGSYEFTGVPLELNMAFIISAEVGGTSYNSDVAVYDGTTTVFELPLTVFDTTTDTSSISADRMHIFFDFSNSGLIQVIEIYILSNSGNKAVVAAGPGQAILTYILPQGASNLQFETGQMDDPFISTENGFGDPTSILPGASSYQLMYSFDLPYGKKIEIKQPLNVSVGSVIVMAPDGIQVSSEQLADGGTRDVQGQPYSMLTAENMAAGDTLTLTISGTPKPVASTGATTVSSQTSLVIGLGIFGGVLILAGVFFLLRARSRKVDLDEDLDADGIDELGNDADRLMDAIASLDDQYKAGSLAQEAYQTRRADLKARLKELL